MVIMLLFMGYSFTLSELQKEGKNTEFNYKTKSQQADLLYYGIKYVTNIDSYKINISST